MTHIIDGSNYHLTEYYNRLHTLSTMFERGELEPEQYIRLCDEVAVEYDVIRNMPSKSFPDDISYRVPGASWAAYCEHTRIMLQTEFKVRLRLLDADAAKANWIIDRHILQMRDAVEHVRYTSRIEDEDD